MQTEIEAKFLDVDADAVREKLRTIGARLVYSERLMRRKNFDYPDRRLEKNGGWIRVRDEGEKVTLSYKQLLDRTITGTKEVALMVDSFDNAALFLTSIGLENKSVQETKREAWDRNGVEVVIDTWPWIPTFIEIEGETEDAVRAVAAELGFDWAQAIHGSVEIIYCKHYDVTEEEVYQWREMVLGPVPEWLEKRRR